MGIGPREVFSGKYYEKCVPQGHAERTAKVLNAHLQVKIIVQGLGPEYPIRCTHML